MKNLLLTAMILFPLFGCNQARDTPPPNDVSDGLRTTVIPMKTVNCVFTLNFYDIDAAYSEANGEGADSYEDVRTFENRLGLLSGFNLPVLWVEPQETQPEDGVTNMLAASYADCETSNDIVNGLAQKHMKIRLDPPMLPVDAQIYVDLAKAQGVPFDEAAFSSRP